MAARRLVNRIAVVEDPLGIRVELFVGPTIAEAPFVSPVTKSGFVTEGLGGAGHAVLVGPDRDALVNFYTLLGFEISDYIKQEVAPPGVAIEFAFMHCNGRHHTLLLPEPPPSPPSESITSWWKCGTRPMSAWHTTVPSITAYRSREPWVCIRTIGCSRSTLPLPLDSPWSTGTAGWRSGPIGRSPTTTM